MFRQMVPLTRGQVRRMLIALAWPTGSAGVFLAGMLLARAAGQDWETSVAFGFLGFISGVLLVVLCTIAKEMLGELWGWIKRG